MAPKLEAKPTIQLTGLEFKRETTLACLYNFPEFQKSVWIPKSLLAIEDREAGAIEVQEWWAKRNDLL